MLTIMLFLLSVVGLTNTLVHGKIVDDEHLGIRSWIRRRLGKYSDVFDCYECTGFWSALFMGMVLVSWNPLVFVPCAFAGSGLMHAYVNIMNLIESKTDFVIGEIDETGTTDQSTAE